MWLVLFRLCFRRSYTGIQRTALVLLFVGVVGAKSHLFTCTAATSLHEHATLNREFLIGWILIYFDFFFVLFAFVFCCVVVVRFCFVVLPRKIWLTLFFVSLAKCFTCLYYQPFVGICRCFHAIRISTTQCWFNSLSKCTNGEIFVYFVCWFMNIFTL